MRVVVVGAGIVGAACARELARAGLAVTVLDRGGPAAGTTAHGEGNILVSDKGPGPELELAKLSRSLWPEILDGLPNAGGVEWDPKGGIVVATTPEGARELEKFAESQRAAGVTAEALDAASLAAAEPHLTREVTAAVHYPDDAQVQPSGAATALLSDALRHGADLRTGCELIGVRTHDGYPDGSRDGASGERGGASSVWSVSRADGNRLTGVRTSQGVIDADLVVNAAGPWSGEVAARLGAPIDVRPRRGEVLVTAPLPPTVFHKVYDADYVGAVGSGSQDLQASTVIESTGAGTILIGSSRRQVGFDDRIRPFVLAELARKALRLYPSLAGVQVMRAYGGFRPYVPDHLPVIGPDPRLPGLWHATGHEGAGIGLSVGTARLLRELVTGAVPSLDPEPFRAGRPAVLGADACEGAA